MANEYEILQCLILMQVTNFWFQISGFKIDAKHPVQSATHIDNPTSLPADAFRQAQSEIPGGRRSYFSLFCSSQCDFRVYV
jgi:hypothetical protein